MIAGRYELLHLAGSGGMGVVWRARDRGSGQTVALKLTLRGTEDEIAMLEREAALLAAVDHPAIPRHVDHGVAEGGARYLAMEWLRGEDLAGRLARGPLDVQATLELGCRIADGLAALHARGIVHCDLKPANVFLPAGTDAVKLLDLGVARRDGAARSVADSGLVGTPFYMAPEQARGEATLDGRVDLYSLGCILFECLAGRPPFLASSPVAVLAKVLFEDPPLLSDLRGGVPAAVEAFIEYLLAKDPASRPPDARSAASWLQDLLQEAGGALPSRAVASITRNERRLASVVLATEAPPDELRMDSTLAVAARPARPRVDLHELAARHGAKLEILADGSVAALLTGSEAPTDLATSAARCALALQALLPEARVALVTGWEVFTGTQPLGRVIDRAADLLHARAGAAGRALLDPMTAALLDERFVLEGADEAPALAGEREIEGEVRRLLGKPAPFLGRDREALVLEGLLDECAGEPAARAVLITGAPGVGKSRLRDELVRRARARSDGVEIWIARGDPMRQRAPFGLLSQLLRRAAGLSDGEPIEQRRQRLAARVAHRVEPSSRRRVTEFLGEVTGTPFPAGESPQLQAARADPMLMGDQMRRAWLDFLEAECAARPVVLVLEDLQWGDRPTVDFVDAALRVLEDRPLLALAVARAEISEAFPALWAERNVTTLQLGKLSRRACEQVVLHALGPDTPTEQVARLVDRSGQNPFVLEELVRAVDEGRGDEVPGTVLAMMQARLASLDPESRRILRAASLFGEVFWRGGVAALLGGAADLDARLAELARREWLSRRPGSKFRGEAEYAFHHGLLREAAYGMLPEEDRQAGHRTAGSWLAGAGETDPMALAVHFDRGGDQARALGHYHAAAQQALGGNDLAGAIERVERAITCGAAGSRLGELFLIRAEAHRWQGSFAEARQWAAAAQEMLPMCSEGWISALREELASLLDTHEQGRILELADVIEGLWASPANVGRALVVATTWIAIRLNMLALHRRAEPFHDRLDGVETLFASEPITQAHLAMRRAFHLGFQLNDMAACGEALRVAGEHFERAGDLRGAYQVRVNLGHVYNELGAHLDSIELLSPLFADSKRLGLWNVAAVAMSHLSKAHLALGRLTEAEIAAHKAVEAFRQQGDERMEAVSRAYLALVLGASGAHGQAEQEAREAVAALGSVPTLEPFALAVLARALLGAGRVEGALEPARRAVASAAVAEEGETLIRLVHAEALEAVGERAGAREAITAAHDRLMARASGIASERWRKSFLEGDPENARTLALWRAWSGGAP